MKTILTFIAILIIQSTQAQLKTNAYIDFGYQKWSHSLYYNTGTTNIRSGNTPLTTSLVFLAKYKIFTFNTQLDTHLDKVPSKLQGRPRYTEYIIGFGLVFNKIQIKYEHSCTHSLYEPEIEELKMVQYRASYSKVIVRLNLWKNDK